MTNQTPSESAISKDDISQEFSQSFAPAIGRLTFEKMRLENELNSALGRAANLEADNVSLKIENTNLVKAHMAHESQLHDLRRELEDRPTLDTVRELEARITELIEAGPTLVDSADLDMAKTEARNEKAAPG